MNTDKTNSTTEKTRLAEIQKGETEGHAKEMVHKKIVKAIA
jgi:hypothetical protein